jgi:hypothetical protein
MNMVKHLVVLIIAFSLIHSYSYCQAQIKTHYSDSILVRKLREQYFNDAKQQFFYSFPSNFKDLNRLYGYNEPQKGPLYDDALNHIAFFFRKPEVIKDTIFYKKIIGISIGGHWEGDAINYFQRELRDKVLAKPNLVLYLLKGKQDKQILSFWRFYFDEPQPVSKIPDNLLFIKHADKSIYQLMEKSLKEVQVSWKKL